MGSGSRELCGASADSAEAGESDAKSTLVGLGMPVAEVLDQVRLRYLWLCRSGNPEEALSSRLAYVRRHMAAYEDLQSAVSIDDFPCLSEAELRADVARYVSDEFAPSDLDYEGNCFGSSASVPRDPVGVYSGTFGTVERIFRAYREALDAPRAGKHLFAWIDFGAPAGAETCIHVHLNFGLVSQFLLDGDKASNGHVTRKLIETDPQVIAGPAQSLIRLDDLCRGSAHPASTQLLLCTGGLLGEDEVETLQNAFGAPVVHGCGLPEAGLIALECLESGNLHVVADSNHVEVALPSGEVGAEGSGELVVTDLENQCLGLVRYRTGVRAELRHLECSCGYDGPTILQWRDESA